MNLNLKKILEMHLIITFFFLSSCVKHGSMLELYIPPKVFIHESAVNRPDSEVVKVELRHIYLCAFDKD